MISKRFSFDSRPLLNLSPFQESIKSAINEKISAKQYVFEDVNCPVCHSNEFEKLAEKDRYGLFFPVVICKDCGLVRSNPRMNENSYRKFYMDDYRDLYEGKPEPDNRFFNQQYKKGEKIYKFLSKVENLNLNEKRKVFEVGCGAGGILEYFKRKGHEVSGIDLNGKYLEFGKKNYNLDLTVSSLTDYSIKNSPDIIIYSHVLEHILNLDQELQNIHKLLSSEGNLYVEVPGIKNLQLSYDMDFLKYLQNAHVYHFTLESLNNLLSKNGFGLIKGNQIIMSVFKKTQEKAAGINLINDYIKTTSFLKNLEKTRKLFPEPARKFYSKYGLFIQSKVI
ncbi:MAG: class I SAM-dependent methyltransferase [Bacteroidales bacterium]